ncbi:hypothetical protein BRYFOR_06556 [Marvinbryantia formatexigens DSM 14469]|uniref:Uncharacterized protein n=1 Tax=Marvinbryantia formatexigens DSM 14469 TaxID=478749 RepID=C6LDE8_9FIRM|nr:hypothetical protein BRYFOR_06556 [Marvinbryantia formatexigens DSM 14469]
MFFCRIFHLPSAQKMSETNVIYHTYNIFSNILLSICANSSFII